MDWDSNDGHQPPSSDEGIDSRQRQNRPVSLSNPYSGQIDELASRSVEDQDNFQGGSESNTGDDQIHLNAPSLHRNQACIPCRTRKIRCDALKPVCTPCTKARRKKRGESGATRQSECVYGPTPGEALSADPKYAQKRKRGEEEVSRREVKQDTQEVTNLKSRIAELESTVNSLKGGFRPNGDLNPSFSMSGLRLDEHHGVPSTSAQTLDGSFPSGPHPEPNHNGSDPMLALLFPGWPSTLPSPGMVYALCQLFMKWFPALSLPICPGRFFTALALPPTHADFPHDSLIHAMCALGCVAVGPTETCGIIFFNNEIPADLQDPNFPPGPPSSDSRRYWGDFNTPGDYHFAEAKKHLMIGLGKEEDDPYKKGKGRHQIFQLTQCCVFLSFYAYLQAKFLEAWVFSGMATRFCVALGLNHIENGNIPDMENRNFLTGRIGLLMPAKEEEEIFERAMTFWLAFMTDNFASATTGWSMSLRITDVSSLLPIPRGAPNCTKERVTPALSVAHPGFVDTHPPDLVGPIQLQLKAVVMLGKVVSFMQHASWDDTLSSLAVRESAAFQELDRDIARFRLSFPKPVDSRNLTTETVGAFIAHALSNVSSILLHSPFCTTAPDDYSMRRCMTSARAVMSCLFLIHHEGYERVFHNPFLVFALSTAGRTLIREYAIKKEQGDFMAMNADEIEVELLINGLETMGKSLPLAASTAETLRDLLQEPSIFLRSFVPPDWASNAKGSTPSSTSGSESQAGSSSRRAYDPAMMYKEISYLEDRHELAERLFQRRKATTEQQENNPPPEVVEPSGMSARTLRWSDIEALGILMGATPSQTDAHGRPAGI